MEITRKFEQRYYLRLAFHMRWRNIENKMTPFCAFFESNTKEYVYIYIYIYDYYLPTSRYLHCLAFPVFQHTRKIFFNV